MGTRLENSSRIHDMINAYVWEHPDWANLHDPDSVKELARWLRDAGLAGEGDNP